MNSKAILAVAGACLSLSAGAKQSDPSAADETTPSMSTLTSYDTKTGGYKGWGTMANLQTPYSPNESMAPRYAEETREHAQQVAEVQQIRERDWIANAPLRADYENVGATRSEAGGSGRFFQRDVR